MLDQIQWEIDHGAYYNPVPPKIPNVDCLVGPRIGDTEFYSVIDGDESVPDHTRHCPTNGCQPEGVADGTWWDKILHEGNPVWKVSEIQ